MKILFLDIDGVLNSRHFISKCAMDGTARDDYIDPEAVARINQITDATGAQIVVSSTWRLPYVWQNRIADLRGLLKRHGITATVRGATPVLGGSKQRGNEIQAWLDEWQVLDVESFVIIDDDSDMAHLMDHLVKTTFTDGIQDEHVQECIKKLGTKVA